jgi:hypothetical protein
MLPGHTAEGFLPAGIHTATWDEFVERFDTNDRRARLLDGLLGALAHLAEAGCAAVLVGGSFVTTKAHPKDVDVIWHAAGVDPDRLDEMFLGPDGLTAMKATFGVECFPHFLTEGASGLAFAEFFQQSRSGVAIGIVEIDLTTLP